MADDNGSDRVIAAITDMGTRVEKRVDRLDEKVDKRIGDVHERIDEVGRTTGILQMNVAVLTEKQKGSTWKSIGLVVGGLGTLLTAIVAAVLFVAKGGG